MTLQEAIRSGRKFRRKSLGDWRNSPEGNSLQYTFTGFDILAEDWEVEEKTVTISESDLLSAMQKTMGRGITVKEIRVMTEELGLREKVLPPRPSDPPNPKAAYSKIG